MLQQRIAASVGNAIGRQYYRQVCVRYWYLTTVFAMNDRNRSSPVSLPGDSPVTQAPRGGLLATPTLGKGVDDCQGSLLHRETIIGARVDQATFLAAVAIRPSCRVIRSPVERDDGVYGQAILTGKIEIALIMGRHPHQGALPILTNHIIGDPHGDRFAG